MSDHLTPEEVEFWQNVDAITELVRKHGGDSRAIAQEAVSLAAQLEEAQERERQLKRRMKKVKQKPELPDPDEVGYA